MLSMAHWNGAFLLPGPAMNTSFCAIPQSFQKDPTAPPLSSSDRDTDGVRKGKSLGGDGRVTGGQWYLAGWLVGGTLCDAMLHK